MKATQDLKNEHQGIELMLRVLRAVAQRLERGETVPAEHLDGIMEFLTVFVDRCHHGKEEAFLFPAMTAAGVPQQGGPIGVMLDEHAQGREWVARIKDALGRHAKNEQGAAKAFRTAVDQYVTLLTQHIAKENTVLFPMADEQLDDQKDGELFEAFEKLERERIGVGKHEAFHALLDQLQATYLK